MTRRRRLDAELVRRHLAPSRSAAQRLIEANKVTVGGAVATKAARLVDPGDALEILGDGARYVSRGGLKLEAALDHFVVDPAGRRVIDIGSSTGGFTDCLLQRGAREVVAIDVGRNQLHEKLRANPAVHVFEQTNVRHTTPADVGGPGQLVVADLSFISLRTVAVPLVAFADDGADLVVLVKPQFEAGKREVDRGRGVIRDPQVWADTLDQATAALTEAGADMMGVMVSPITGGDGNVEFLVHAQRRSEGDATGKEALVKEVDRQAWIDQRDAVIEHAKAL